MSWNRYEWERRIVRFFSAAPMWTSLNTLGRSRLISLTVLVPFLGGLILFNQQLVNWLSIVPEFIGGHSDVRSFTLSRLAYSYFGLAFLGVASFLFLLFCPSEVKANGSLKGYIESERPFMTRARIGLVFMECCSLYSRWLPNYGEEAKWYRPVFYSDSLERLFWDSMTRTFLTVMNEDLDLGIRLYEEDGKLNPCFTDREEVNVPYIADFVFSGAKVIRSLADRITDRIDVVDVLTMHYLGKDVSRFPVRAIITVLYILGFTVLLIPTTWTFFLVLRRIAGL